MEKKRCKVVMLPTDKTDGTLWKTTIGQLIHTHLSGEYKEKYQPFNLYIISDDKIEEDDWVIETSNNNALEQFADYSLNQKSMGCKKIIATTDSELKLSYDGKTPISKDWNGKQLPQIPQAFIEEYCLKGGIDEVDVEYEVTPSLKIGDNYNIGGEVRKVTDVWLGTNDAWYVSTPNNHAWSCPIELNPKVNSDNTINIHSIKDTYTRDEVINKLKEYWNKTHGEGANNQRLIDWIKENL